MFAFIKTTNSIILSKDGKRWSILKDDKNWAKIIDCLKQKDWNKLLEFLEPKQRIIKYSNNVFNIDDEGKLFINNDDTEVPKFLASKIEEFYKEELPYEPLVNLWNRLKKNPSKNSVEQLYRFLDNNHLPITEDGMLIAYKGVDKGNKDDEFFSNHTGKDGKKVLNKIGTTVVMDRGNVVDDPNVACDAGLHVGSYSYAKSFASVLLEVLVDPMDVVSIPHDSNSQKVRVCKYQILGLMNDGSNTKNIKPDIKKDEKLPIVDATIVTHKKTLTAREIRDAALLKIDKDSLLYISVRRYDISNKKGLIKLLEKNNIKISSLAHVSDVQKVIKYNFVPNYSLTSRKMLEECCKRLMDLDGKLLDTVDHTLLARLGMMIHKKEIDRSSAITLIKNIYSQINN